MRVLVTGGSGFLGSYICEQLTAEGHVVRALVRPASDKMVLEKLPRVEFAPGFIEDPASLAKAVLCVDAIIHAAGLVKARKPADFFVTNAQGSRNLLQAAEEGAPAPRRLVHVSSLAAAPPCAHALPPPQPAPP